MKIRKLKRLWKNRRWIFRSLLLEDGSFGGPPNNERNSPDVRGLHENVTYSCHFNNDAYEIWFWQEFDGEPGKWAFFLDAGAFRRMALWYLWRWAWGEWFGLRRKLFYWDLNRRWAIHAAAQRPAHDAALAASAQAPAGEEDA